MARFKIRHTYKSTKKEAVTTDEGKIELPYWDDKSRTLIVGDTEEVTFSIVPTSITDTEGYQLVKKFKFDLFDVETKHNYGFIDVDSAGKEILGTSKDYISHGNPFTLKGNPGFKGKVFWAEYFNDDKSHFEKTKGKPSSSHPLGEFVIFQRPDPIIESVEWLDPKTKDPVKEKNLGQYVILRIKSKYLEKETIKISLWEYDNQTESIVTQRSRIVYPRIGYIGKYTYREVSREVIDPETGEKWKGTVESMDFGFAINHDVMKEKLNPDGSLDILVHLNPAWIQNREGKDNMVDNLGDSLPFTDLEVRIKIDHPRLPVYDESISKSGSKSGLYYGNLDVNKKVITEEIPLEVSKMVAAIVQNDSAMEAKGSEPCKYTYISVTEKGKDPIVLFKEADMVPTQLHDFKVLLGDEKKGKKTITIDLDDPKETDPTKKLAVCPDVKALNLNNTHKGKTFNTEKVDAKFIKTQADNQLVLEAYTETPDVLTALKNAWLPNIDPIPLKVLAQTCRYQRWINIQGYPDLQYELSFKSSPDADSLYNYKTKNFIKRDYAGSLGLLKRKKDRKKRKKQNRATLKEYKKEQKNRTLSDLFIYSDFEIGFEYSLAGIKQSEIAVSGEHPIFDAIDTFMYITNKIGALCFDKEVKKAEKEHDPKKVEKRKNKRNKHLKNIEKKAKKMQKGLKKGLKK